MEAKTKGTEQFPLCLILLCTFPLTKATRKIHVNASLYERTRSDLGNFRTVYTRAQPTLGTISWNLPVT